MRRGVYLGALATALALVAGASGTSQSTGTLQLNAKLSAKWHLLPACPAGQPSSVSCYTFEGQAAMRGLGAVTERYGKTFDGACTKSLPEFMLIVAGKGDLTGTMTGPTCHTVPPIVVNLDIVITGGTGAYAGASGSIHITSAIFERAAGVGVSTDTYTGSLSVPGLEFDVTAPVLSGARSKTVRAPKGAKRARVRYLVSAQDAVDGAEHAACKPSSGAGFKVGRTRVTCAATDSSANTATASFTITVKPARH